MRTKFITYATPNFLKNATTLANSASIVGFDEVRVFTVKDIENTEFYRRNFNTLSQSRGAGYWLWKPYLILKELEKAKDNELIFYSDAGRSNYYQFSRFPKNLVDLAIKSNQGYVLGPSQTHLGTVRNWVKRDCLKLMEADTEKYHSKGLLLTWSLWRRTPQALNFIEKWLNYCEDERCLTDMPNVCGSPNYIEFRDHRHDMSILTLLAYKESSTILDFTKTLTHKILNLRPNSSLAHHFYKRPENTDSLLASDNPLILFRELFRLKKS